MAMPRILLVDDNEMNRDMLARRLTRRGFEVVTAIDGSQGMDAARAQKPDLILMDMRLPDMDGWMAAQTIKAEEPTRDIPIIALTAHAMEGDRETALEAGCDDYETKPVEINRLLGKINQWLGVDDSPLATPNN
jgi:CheY-like chemotaxis protein